MVVCPQTSNDREWLAEAQFAAQAGADFAVRRARLGRFNGARHDVLGALRGARKRVERLPPQPHSNAALCTLGGG